MLVVIKIGSNVLTGVDTFLDVERVRSLVSQVAALKAQGHDVVLVSSGAVASGRSLVSMDSVQDIVSRRQVLASVGQVKLIATYAELFGANGLTCAQVLVTKEDFRDKRHYANMENCLQTLLRNKIIPIINENDVISVTELMFTDNDELAGLVASMLNAQKLVILTNVNGIYDGPPGEPGSRRITDISVKDTMALRGITTVKSSFGRGGMLTKSTIARKLALLGIPVHIADGTMDNVLPRLFSGEDLGTRFVPEKGSSRQKKYIAHADGAVTGDVRIDDGAKEALSRATPTSLLPVGVTRVTGTFRAGDVIRILDATGRAIGLGKAQMNSEKADELKGRKNQKPLVHYDFLFLY
jgi:glutamate 5-kinase